MNLPSNTPPDGDFASYVERLTDANAAAGARENLFKPQEKTSLRAPSAAAAGAAPPKAKLTPAAVTGAAFLTHVKWVVVLWIATQALSAVLPGAGFLFLPALLAYGAWAIFQANRQSSGALVQRLRELARQAAEETQKNQPPKKK